MGQRHTRTVKVSEVLPAIRTVTATIGRAPGRNASGDRSARVDRSTGGAVWNRT